MQKKKKKQVKCAYINQKENTKKNAHTDMKYQPEDSLKESS